MAGRSEHQALGPGRSLYLIEVIDSVYGMDEAYEKKKVNKSVQFKILDTTDVELSNGTVRIDECSGTLPPLAMIWNGFLCINSFTATTSMGISYMY